MLKEGKFTRLNVLKVRQALDAATQEPVSEVMKEKLVKLWDKYAEPLMRSLETRSSDRAIALEKALQNRCDKEVNDLSAILTELQQSILHELEESEKPIQLSLFNDAEKDQFEKNRNSLRRRVEEIPEEIERETGQTLG